MQGLPQNHRNTICRWMPF